MSQLRRHVWMRDDVTLCGLRTQDDVKTVGSVQDVPVCGPCLVGAEAIRRTAVEMLLDSPYPEEDPQAAAEELATSPRLPIAEIRGTAVSTFIEESGYAYPGFAER